MTTEYVTLGGYSARSTTLKDGSADLLKTHIKYESFARLRGMGWLEFKFTPSPLIDLHRTLLAPLVLTSEFLLDMSF
ncbi:hypothetical protein FRC12_001255 [Ceratobasidium sp. 428]|nr:hypothetical protein FRC12_001255 [Ceratobasidium sp. 428]